MNVKLVSTICALSTVACSTTATIRRRSGADEELTLLRRTPSFLVTKNGDRERPIPHHDIVDIDHPGNVHAVVGTLLLAYGILNIAVGAPRCEKEGAAFCVGVSRVQKAAELRGYLRPH